MTSVSWSSKVLEVSDVREVSDGEHLAEALSERAHLSENNTL